MTTTRTYLSVAGFSFHVFSQIDIRLDAGFNCFITSKPPNIDISIECRRMTSGDFIENGEKVFTSANDELTFYEIYRKNDRLLFVIFNQDNQSEIQQYALLEADLRNWVIWSHEKEGSLEPLIFPLFPIILYYSTLTADAVMMHASGVFDGEKGRMFSGFSGAGKSTISGIWKMEGNQLINDDRLIIRLENEQYFIYNTPMYYEDENKKSPLDAVFLIYHSPENVIRKLDGALAVTGILAFSIQNNYDERFILHHLDFFNRLCKKIPVYRLGFVPNKAVIGFIKEKTS